MHQSNGALTTARHLGSTSMSSNVREGIPVYTLLAANMHAIIMKVQHVRPECSIDYTADMLAALGTTLCGLIVWLYTHSFLSLTTTWVPNFPCT